MIRRRAARVAQPTTWVWTLVVASGLALAPPQRAHAYHSDTRRSTQGTAFALHRQEWQIGLFHAEYGALDWLQPSTYTVPWLFGFPNAQLKLLLFQNPRWAVALRPGFMYLNSEYPEKLYGLSREGTDVRLWVVPVEGYVSAVIARRYVLTLAVVYNFITGSGTYDPGNFAGAAAASNAQLGLGFQWRVNRVVELILQTRLVAFQEAGGAGAIQVDVDANTHAEVQGQGDTSVLDAKRGLSVSAAGLFAFRHTHLRLGIGYGNYNVPGLNVVVPERHPFPVFDLFWRWGGVPRPIGPVGW